MKPLARLAELGLELPEPPKPSASYLPFVREGDLVQLAGVAPVHLGRYAVVGTVGSSLEIADGIYAARLCALNLMANLSLACGGDLSRVRKFLGVRGYVRASADFLEVPRVINGASDLLIEVFGSAVGSHARTAIGCATLPSGVAVEIDALVKIDDSGLGS